MRFAYSPITNPAIVHPPSEWLIISSGTYLAGRGGGAPGSVRLRCASGTICVRQTGRAERPRVGVKHLRGVFYLRAGHSSPEQMIPSGSAPLHSFWLKSILRERTEERARGVKQ